MTKRIWLVLFVTVVIFLIAMYFNEKRIDTPIETGGNVPTTTSTGDPGQNTQATTTDSTPFAKDTTNRDCLIRSENFFETKRVGDLDLYSASWMAYYESSSGMCFVQITSNNGVAVYSVDNGYQYKLQGGVFKPLK